MRPCRVCIASAIRIPFLVEMDVNDLTCKHNLSLLSVTLRMNGLKRLSGLQDFGLLP